MFRVLGKHNGKCVYKFEGKFDKTEEVTDSKLLAIVKANTKDITQRKVDGKEL